MGLLDFMKRKKTVELIFENGFSPTERNKISKHIYQNMNDVELYDIELDLQLMLGRYGKLYLSKVDNKIFVSPEQ